MTTGKKRAGPSIASTKVSSSLLVVLFAIFFKRLIITLLISPLNNKKIRNIPKPIKRGLSLKTKLELLYSFYDGGNNQQYVGLGAGPEIVLGNFIKKSLLKLINYFKI